jgi:hypothetical protein
MHLLRDTRHQLAQVHAGHRGRDAAEGAAEIRVRLRVPALELADAAIQPDEEHLLLALAQRLRESRRSEPAQRAERGAEEGAAGERMLARGAEGMRHEVSGS